MSVLCQSTPYQYWPTERYECGSSYYQYDNYNYNYNAYNYESYAQECPYVKQNVEVTPVVNAEAPAVQDDKESKTKVTSSKLKKTSTVAKIITPEAIKPKVELAKDEQPKVESPKVETIKSATIKTDAAADAKKKSKSKVKVSSKKAETLNPRKLSTQTAPADNSCLYGTCSRVKQPEQKQTRPTMEYLFTPYQASYYQQPTCATGTCPYLRA